MRWLNRDPIGYNGGENLYAYVNGDPVNYHDPDGLDATNNYKHPVWIKPEDGELILLPPGKTHFGPVDGLRHPSGYWYKASAREHHSPPDLFIDRCGNITESGGTGPLNEYFRLRDPFIINVVLPSGAFPMLSTSLPDAIGDFLPGYKDPGFSDRHPNWNPFK